MRRICHFTTFAMINEKLVQEAGEVQVDDDNDGHAGEPRTVGRQLCPCLRGLEIGASLAPVSKIEVGAISRLIGVGTAAICGY